MLGLHPLHDLQHLRRHGLGWRRRCAPRRAFSEVGHGIGVLADPEGHERPKPLPEEPTQPVGPLHRVGLEPEETAFEDGATDERRRQQPLSVPFPDERDGDGPVLLSLISLCVGQVQEPGDDLVSLPRSDVEPVDREDEILAVGVL